MSRIVIVDTTVLLNVLDVPDRNQDRDTVLTQFEDLVDAGSNLLLPMAAVFEAGNHIARLGDGGQRRRYAEVFRDQVREAVAGQAPWTLIPPPDNEQLANWLDSFPDSAMRGAEMSDLSIIKAWERSCVQHPGRRVSIWSLDRHHLDGYDRIP